MKIERRNTMIEKIGKTPVVILPLKGYEDMREELEMLNSKKLSNEIEKARQEIQKGEVYSIDEIKRKLLRDKYNGVLQNYEKNY